MLTRRPQVQSQLQLQHQFDGSPRVAVQAKMAETLNGRPGARTVRAVAQAVWEGDEEEVQKWDSLIDGVQWSRNGPLLWYEIVDTDQIQLGTEEAYRKWEHTPYTEQQWDQIEETGEAPPEADFEDGSDVSGEEEEARKFDLVSIRVAGSPATETTADAVDADTAFGGLGGGEALESVSLVRPFGSGTNHYEVQAMVGGVPVKIDLTSSGFRLIYNAAPPGPGYSVDKPTPIKGKTGSDLYQAFLKIALSRNYHMELYDCQAFAEELVQEITTEVKSKAKTVEEEEEFDFM